jgi:hypothetical protein
VWSDDRVEMPSDVEAAPKEKVLEACARLGRDVVVDWCADLLTGRIDNVRAVEDDSLPSLAWLGWRSVHPDAGGLTAGEAAWTPADPVNAYWVRVWAARAFLYVWRDDVVEALIQAAGDEAWRVREHVARITAKRELGSVVPHLLPMLEHELPRVRAAAVRAIGAAGEAEHAAALGPLTDDEDHTVRAAVERALDQLSRRLDRPLPTGID